MSGRVDAVDAAGAGGASAAGAGHASAAGAGLASAAGAGADVRRAGDHAGPANGATTRIPIDTHVHLWDRSVVPQTWIDPDSMAAIDRDFSGADLGAQLRDIGVTRAVVVQSDGILIENDHLFDEAERSPELAGVVGWVDLRAGADGVRVQLDALGGIEGSSRLVGIRHPVHIDEDERWLSRDDVAAGLAELGAHGLAFDLVIRPWQLEQAARLAERVPGTQFVLDHLGKPPLSTGELDAWNAGLRQLAALPNVAAKISGLTIEDDWADWSEAAVARAIDPALELFGPSRLMFGSDWPLVRLTRGGYRGWIDAYRSATASLSDDEQRQIDVSTAERVYGLSEGAGIGVGVGQSAGAGAGVGMGAGASAASVSVGAGTGTGAVPGDDVGRGRE
ncbi:amidohydrolase family protein [Pseudoclavibacter helvolus]|uniref:amidohydrolase family protein n=1 Tax=Pseudoclavibacter helvolus TaxID=255205 RepID=UPI003C74F915